MELKITNLADRLNEAASKVRGRVAYSVLDASNSISCERGTGELFRSASLIKIPILFTYLQGIQKRELDAKASIAITPGVLVPGTGVLKNFSPGSTVTLEEAARLMITESDNVATNILIDLLTFKSINETIAMLGLTSTTLRRKMQDFDAAAKGLENTTCVADMRKLLVQISQRRSYDSIERKAFEILLAQNLNEKLPKLVPPSVRCAHKTGDLPKLEHDAGIFTNGTRDIVVVVLTDDLADNFDGVRFCQEVGKCISKELSFN